MPQLRSGSPPGKVHVLASRVLRSLIDVVDLEHRRERRHSRAERRSTFAVSTMEENNRFPLCHLQPPSPTEDGDSGISSGSLIDGFIDDANDMSQANEDEITEEYVKPTKSTRRRVKSESENVVHRVKNSEDGSRWPSFTKLIHQRFNSRSYDRQTSEPGKTDVVIYVTDPMGAVSSRERRTSSIGCWSTKSNSRIEEDDSYAPPTKPSKLRLEVKRSTSRCMELPTPTSESENDGPPLAQSSNERLLQIIRCFPFPTPRTTPRESPRLKRKTNGSADTKDDTRIKLAAEKMAASKKRSRSVDHKEKETKCCSDDRGYRHVMGQLVQVSVETMAITALPKESIDTWLKERLKKWIQLSGHEGSIVPASLNSLYKKQTGMCIEGTAYQAIMDDPALCGFAPRFYQQIEKNDETFIEIEDLLSRFAEPSQTAIMDIKIGTRTFLESEVSNTKLRKDLYEKMVAIDPSEATEEERRTGEITKLRYMQFRERESSTAALGFRIEAAKLPGGELQKNFKKVRTAADVAGVFRTFLADDRKRVAEALIDRLISLRSAIEKSTFFAQHEVVGSSLLVLFDKEKVGVWMIDFAKAVKIPPGRTMNHRSQWVPGNGEDGYLTGIDSLIEILEDLPLKDAPIISNHLERPER